MPIWSKSAMSDRVNRIGEHITLARLDSRVATWRRGADFRQALHRRDMLKTQVILDAGELAADPDGRLASGVRLTPAVLMDLATIACPRSRALFADLLGSSQGLSASVAVSAAVDIYNRLIATWPKRVRRMQLILAGDGETVDRCFHIRHSIPATRLFDMTCQELLGTGMRFAYGLTRESQFLAAFSGPDTFELPVRDDEGRQLVVSSLIVLTDSAPHRRYPVVLRGVRFGSARLPAIDLQTTIWAPENVSARNIRVQAETTMRPLLSFAASAVSSAADDVVVRAGVPLNGMLLYHTARLLARTGRLPTRVIGRDAQRLILYALSDSRRLLSQDHSVAQFHEAIREVGRVPKSLTRLALAIAAAGLSERPDLTIGERVRMAGAAFSLLTIPHTSTVQER